VESADDSGLADTYGDMEFATVSVLKSSSSTSHNSLLGVLVMVCEDTVSIGVIMLEIETRDAMQCSHALVLD